MSPRAWWAACGAALVMAGPGAALGATLSSQSSIGFFSDFASNPFFRRSGAEAAESLAVVANLPATYTSDTQVIDLIPRLRLAQSYGPVALLSNYAYLDGDWQWKRERNTFSASAEWHHDSTYYNQFENVSLLGHDLARREQSASLAWQRALSERSDLQASGSWDQVAYSHNSASSLANYTYAQGAGRYDYLLNERWQLSGSLGYGQYRLLEGAYSSAQRFGQLELKRTLSELWSLTAQVGYSELSARALRSVCCEIVVDNSGQLHLVPVPVAQTASRGAPNYSLSAERRGERVVLDLGASRAIQPSGLGALLIQDDVSVGARLPWTERLSLGATLHWSRVSDPLDRLDLSDRQYYQAVLDANWQWTEHWTLSLQSTFEKQYLTPQLPAASGVTVYAALIRQFGRLRL